MIYLYVSSYVWYNYKIFPSSSVKKNILRQYIYRFIYINLYFKKYSEGIYIQIYIHIYKSVFISKYKLNFAQLLSQEFQCFHNS